tara:strand:- start:6093 stop:6818 length:726 start_codon:yes stop_codon:yes gene_type:complete
MPLPTIATPTYELKLPSTNKKIKYRPFLVREEKVLIIALDSKNQDEMTNAVKDVLSKCILTDGINVDQLPTFDIEYVFLNIRAKSIGEDIRLTVTCPDDGETQVSTTIYVDEVKVIKAKNHKKDIVLDDKLTLRMKYPSLDQFINSNFQSDDNPEVVVDKTFQVIADCIETVYTEEEAWEGSDFSNEERMKFIEQLNSKQYKKVEEFFTTMPKLSHTFEVVNPNTKKKNKIVLEGLADFFG